MAKEYTATVEFANGRPVPDARVRLFDKDARDDDDDLTIQPGVCDENGQFTVTYKEQRRLDFTDIFLPYLHIEYKYQDEHKVHKAFIQPFKSAYRVPDIPPVKFVPAEHGFQFVNRFPGYWIPFSIPAIPDIPSVDAIYGLCGGMCATSYDYLLAGQPIPVRRRVPGRARPLHQYIHRRQVDSLDKLGRQVVRFVRWMTLPDEAVQKRTLAEFEKLQKRLDRGNPTPIGMVYVSTRDTMQIWQNHQVLATSYTMEGGQIRIQIYDPNYPRRNDVLVVSESDGAGGLRSGQYMGEKRKHARGFFVMPYAPMIPPEGLADIDK
jgi:hypothetical protein